ncbi:DUF4840 domain-containing protein [Prevotella pallens]|jgi:putative lipoprotein|uniref:DUF4840 domain-containing protein n=1 Tax=Prevotella pallens TaxID=60133 RepID=UPI0028E40319|nr:DUF4840 domain-containing protein [Prevotella pallens]
MKKTLNKLMLVVFSSIALLGITSCNLDNNNKEGLTPAEVKAAFNSVKGNYTGKVFFNKLNNSISILEKDSLPVSVTINTDSTLIIKNLPLKVLTGQLEDKDLKSAIESLGTTDVLCYIAFIDNDPITLLVNPTPLSLNINYKGKTQTFKTGFFINNRNSVAQLSERDRLAIQIIQFGSMYLDEKLITSRANNSAIFLKLERR